MLRLFRNVLLVSFLGGLLLLGSCAHQDLRQAVTACATDTVKAEAKKILPQVLASIQCMETTDAGANQCVQTNVLDPVTSEVLTCTLALIHDQVIP
jgi:hypothetical protein